MNEIMEKEMISIDDMIYEVRGVQVMLDSDLAELYQVETKRINEAVKNNPDKFPERFSFVLDNFSTANISNMSRVNPRVFTEQGVYMLATILKSKVATKVSIAIMDAFVKMRHYINYNYRVLPHSFLLLEDKVDDNTKRINELFDKFDPKDIVKDYIFFEGEFYDAYSVLLDILNEACNEIIIIDNYAGKELLDTLRNIDRKIIIVSKNINDELKKKYGKQYSNVEFISNCSFYNRFIVIDRKKLYLCGASFKDLGKKCFGISEFGDSFLLDKILKVIEGDTYESR